MRKKVIWIVLLIVSHAVAFFGGSVVGGRISKSYLYQEFDKANAPVMLSHYEIFRDIAKGIREGNYDIAICHAELGASSNLDDIRTCLENDYCKASIEKEVSQQAPEIISGSPLAFDYKPADGAIRRCE